MKVSAKELRSRTRELLECVARGEEVTVTYRGKPRAKLVPIDQQSVSETDSAAALALFGIWKDRDDTMNVREYVDRARESRY
jgi:prevent-host-death family protein